MLPWQRLQKAVLSHERLARLEICDFRLIRGRRAVFSPHCTLRKMCKNDPKVKFMVEKISVAASEHDSARSLSGRGVVCSEVSKATWERITSCR